MKSRGITKSKDLTILKYPLIDAHYERTGQVFHINMG